MGAPYLQGPPAGFDWDDYSWDEETGVATFSRWDPEVRKKVDFQAIQRRCWLSAEERAALSKK